MSLLRELVRDSSAQRVLWKNHCIPDKYSSKLLSGFLRFYRLIFFSYTIYILSQLATCYSTGCHKSSWYSQRSLKVKCLMKVYLGEPKWVFRELVETLLIVSLLWGLRDECKSVSVSFNSHCCVKCLPILYEIPSLLSFKGTYLVNS